MMLKQNETMHEKQNRIF